MINNNVSTKDKVLVSICCLAYNHEKYIRQCLEGFVMQKTNFGIEVLVHDDASLDNTANIIREYEAKYPEIIKPIYQTENQYSKGVGVTSTFNFPRAKGKYIAICEGDDYWTDPFKLQKQVDFLERNENYSMCFTHQLVVSDTEKVIQKREYDDKIYSTYDIVKGFIPGTQTMVFRNYENLTALIRKLSPSPSGDRLLAYCCSLFGNLYLIPEFTAAYRQTGKGVWSSIATEERYFFALEEFIKFHISIGLPVNNEFVHERINGAYRYLLKKDRKRFFKNIHKVIDLKRKYNIKSNFSGYFIQKLRKS